jgi:site-specific DNA-adenine methylase
MMKIRGLSNYLGSKGGMGTAERIINLIRTHETLVIPFAGHCAITREMRWPDRVLINDLDTTVVDAWRAASLDPQLEVYNLPALDCLHAVLARLGLGWSSDSTRTAHLQLALSLTLNHSMMIKR